MFYSLIKELVAILVGLITIAMVIGLVDEDVEMTPIVSVSRPRIPSRRVLDRRFGGQASFTHLHRKRKRQMDK